MFKYFLVVLLFYNSFQRDIPTVYFIKNITSENVVRMFKKLDVKLEGNVGLKVHSGEKGGKYFLTPDFLQKIYDYTKGTFIECNTAYENHRHNTSIHKELLKEHHWLDNDRRFVIMDENPENDFALKVKDGTILQENYVGEHLHMCKVLNQIQMKEYMI